MTTIVTVKTGTCPAAVQLNGSSYYSDDQRTQYSNSNSTEFLPADTQRDFTISSGCHLSVAELPEGATGLNDGKECGQAAGVALG